MKTKETITLSIIAVAAFIGVAAYSTYEHNQMVEKGVYIEDNCPLCGSNEVVNMGDDCNGTKAHCPDCGADFSISYKQYDDEECQD
jgi:transcription elongation factor Elf1